MIVLEGLRVIFGSLFVLFLPGFAWSFVFFDKTKKEIDWLERVVLSIGLFKMKHMPKSVSWQGIATVFIYYRHVIRPAYDHPN